MCGIYYDGSKIFMLSGAVPEKQLEDMKPSQTQTSCAADCAALLLLDQDGGFGWHSADGRWYVALNAALRGKTLFKCTTWEMQSEAAKSHKEAGQRVVIHSPWWKHISAR